MSTLFDKAFLDALTRIAVKSRLSVEGTMAGNRKSIKKGSSAEFSDFREYTPGDDYRRIDWNAYGRFEKLYIKLFMEEREAPVSVFLDTSKSMDWGQPLKSTASRQLAAAISYVTLKNYDSLNLYCISDAIREKTVLLRGTASFSKVLSVLESVEYGGNTSFYQALKGCRLKSRGLSVIISDLFCRDDIKETLKYLSYNKQEIYVCHILSPQENNPEPGSAYRLQDIETGGYVNVTLSSDVLKAYKKALEGFIIECAEACRKYNAQYVPLDTSNSIEYMMRQVVRE